MNEEEKILSALQEAGRRLQIFQQSGDPATVLSPEATAVTSTLIESALADDPQINVLYAAGMMCWSRFLVMLEGPDREQLELACTLLAPVYRLQPEAVPTQLHKVFASSQNPPTYLAAYDSALDMFEGFQTTGNLKLLKDSADALFSLSGDFAGTPQEGHYLSNLSFILMTLHDFDSDPDILNQATSTARKAVELSTTDPGERANAFVNLGNALSALWDLTQDTGLIEESLQVFRNAVSVAPINSPDRVTALVGLGTALENHYDLTGDAESLIEAVHQTHASLEALAGLDGKPADHGLDEAVIWFNLGGRLDALYKHTGNISLLEEELQVLRNALRLTPESDPYRPLRFANLANCLNALADLTNDVTMLDEAVKMRRIAVELTPGEHPNRALVLSALSDELCAAFDVRGDPAKLAEAVATGRAALGAVVGQNPDLAKIHDSLSAALFRMYGPTGEQALLQESVDHAREAVNNASLYDPNYATYRSNLAISLARFSDMGGGSTLNEAVEVGRSVLEHVPKDSPLLGEFESNLAGVLLMAYERSKADDLLLEAVEIARRSLKHTPEGHVYLAQRRDFLGIALDHWYKHSGDRAALLEAIRMARLAVVSTNQRDPRLGTRISNLAAQMQQLFRETGNDATLALAAEFGRRAVQALPETHFYYANALLNTGIFLEELAGSHPSKEILAEAVKFYSKCADNAAGVAMTRITGAYRWAVTAMLADQKLSAVQAVEAILALLPQVVGRALDRDEREFRLEKLPGLPYTSAGILITAGYIERAIEILDATRGMLFAEAVEDRRDIAEIRASAPELAERYDLILREFATVNHESSVFNSTPQV